MKRNTKRTKLKQNKGFPYRKSGGRDKSPSEPLKMARKGISYLIRCPNCEAIFDVKEEIDNFKLELLQTLEFFEEVKKLHEN